MTTHELTKNQRIVLDTLRASKTPMSAYQILDADNVRSNGLKAPLTIYRALEKLVEASLVHRIESLNAFVHCGNQCHADAPAFMICHQCNNFFEFETPAIQRAVMKHAAEQGFEVDQMHVEVSGRCRKCAN